MYKSLGERIDEVLKKNGIEQIEIDDKVKEVIAFVLLGDTRKLIDKAIYKEIKREGR